MCYALIVPGGTGSDNGLAASASGPAPKILSIRYCHLDNSHVILFVERIIQIGDIDMTNTEKLLQIISDRPDLLEYALSLLAARGNHSDPPETAFQIPAQAS